MVISVMSLHQHMQSKWTVSCTLRFVIWLKMSIEEHVSFAPTLKQLYSSAISIQVAVLPSLISFWVANYFGEQMNQTMANTQSDSLLSGPLVDIYVGKTKRHWALHRNLLCHHSERLESELQESHDSKRKWIDKLELPDHDPAGFELLVKWMYQGRLDDVSDIADPQEKYEYAVKCYKLYMLCDRFEMPQLKNVAMDQYRKGLHDAELVPDAQEINELYRKSPSGSPFRRLMTKIAARQIMDPESDADVETYRECFEENPDFVVDLVKSIKLGTGGMLFDDPTAGDNCEYHDHEGAPNCQIRGKGKVKLGKHSFH